MRGRGGPTRRTCRGGRRPAGHDGRRAARRALVAVLASAGTIGCAAAGRGAARPEPAAAPAPRPGDPAPGAAAPAEPLVGGCGPAPADLIPHYLLPFPVGDAHTLTQGNCGAASHGGRFRYAFDFEMPVGSPVVAARDGVVHTVRDGHPDGTDRLGDENLVILLHPDGQLSRYIHLERGGALVVEGQRVSAGDTIARSGDSGRSAFPHLHFDVSDRCGAAGCVTVPSAFRNAAPAIPVDRAPVRALPPDGGS